MCVEGGGGGRGVWPDRGGWGVGGGRWYTLVPVSPLIKSSLSEPEGAHTHLHIAQTHTQSHTR